jgi:hypothetical protein
VCGFRFLRSGIRNIVRTFLNTALCIWQKMRIIKSCTLCPPPRSVCLQVISCVTNLQLLTESLFLWISSRSTTSLPYSWICYLRASPQRCILRTFLWEVPREVHIYRIFLHLRRRTHARCVSAPLNPHLMNASETAQSSEFNFIRWLKPEKQSSVSIVNLSV